MSATNSTFTTTARLFQDRAPRAQEGEADVDRVLLMRVTVQEMEVSPPEPLCSVAGCGIPPNLRRGYHRQPHIWQPEARGLGEFGGSRGEGWMPPSGLPCGRAAPGQRDATRASSCKILGQGRQQEGIMKVPWRPGWTLPWP